MRSIPLSLACCAALAGCGSSGDNQSDSSTRPQAPATAKAVNVGAKDFSFTPTKLAAKAGKVAFTLHNHGATEHEFVVLKTNASPGSLPVDAKGRVSEKTSVGEVSETPAGKSASASIDLKPGRYVFVCNIPGHYKDGMHGQLVVS